LNAGKVVYSVNAHRRVLLSASSRARLIAKLEEDQAHWEKAFPTAPTISGYSYQHRYQTLIQRVRECPPDQTVFDASDRGAAIFPTVGAPEAHVLDHLIANASDLEVASLLRWWWARNGWLPRGNEDLYLALGSAIFHATAISLEAIKLGPNAAKIEDSAAKLVLAAQLQLDESDAITQHASAIRSNIDEAGRRAVTREKALERLVSSELKKGVARLEKRRQEWEERWENTHKVFMDRLTLTEPVKMWGAKATEHRDAARDAFKTFLAAGAVAIGLAIAVMVFFGQTIGSTFYRQTCPAEGPCVDVFSFQGPLTVGALLLVASLLIWLVRFQTKLYLSERHLALEAEERMAFTKAYLALTADKHIDGEQQAIVLSALFRHAQDGVIKDDDSSLDISAAAILAKAISGPKGG
jgi:hypothetical protein